MRGPSISAARRRGVATTPPAGAATSCGPRASATGGRGPRAAFTSRSARSMLPVGRGACITAATGDGAFRAPPGAGPQRVKAMEVPGATRFTAPYVGAPMRRGPPAPIVHRVGTFGLFLLLGGVPTAFHTRACRSGGGGGGKGIHGSGKISEEEVVLEEVSKVPRASRRLHLKVRPASKCQVPVR
jgi:hypothetical protein